MRKFDSTKKELIEEIKTTLPPQEWCNNPIWNGKYGHYWFGIGDGFAWDFEELELASEKKLLEILVMCHSAWKEKYKGWYDKQATELQKVYKFARNCREFIYLEDTSYESNFVMLDKALEFIKQHKSDIL